MNDIITKKRVAACPEILGVLLNADVANKSTNELKANPTEFIAHHYNLDLSELTLHIADNSEEIINLSLPYYSKLDKVGAEVLADASLEEIAGSELITLVIALCGLLAFGVAGASAGAFLGIKGEADGRASRNNQEETR